MSDFRPLSETELSALSTEGLIAYHHEARQLGRHAEARTALGILVWSFQDRVHFWVSRTVPRQDVDDIVDTVFESALNPVPPAEDGLVISSAAKRVQGRVPLGPRSREPGAPRKCVRFGRTYPRSAPSEP